MAQLLIDHPVPGLARLTLSNPARRNALDAQMWAALPDTLAGVANTPGLRGLMVRGAGDHFCSGADVSEFEALYSTQESAAKISASIQRGFHALADFPLPTLAVIRGSAVGGGAGIALCCDVRMADATARFAITPAKLGLIYPFADIARLADAVGLANARDMLLSARVVPAADAKAIGLVHDVVGTDDLDSAAADYASRWLSLSPESLRVTKTMLRAYARGQRTDTAQTDAMFLGGFSSRDFGEGFRAFLDKRKPNFN